MTEVRQQRVTRPVWQDESGRSVPTDRLTKNEKLQERQSAKLFSKAAQLNKKLADYKEEMRAICQDVYTKAMEENGGNKDRKGNFTWYNFDRSIKIEVNINERIDFDDLTIQACKDKLDEFLTENVEAKDAFIKELVMDAFETSRGKLDAKKVLSLLRYRSKIKSPLFQEALNLLEKGMRRPDSKTYFRIWGKNAEGQYENVDLNFSSI